MKRFLFAIALSLGAATTFAGNCPVQMKAIDAALPNAKLSRAALGKAKGSPGIK